jgi:ribosome maturation factor RimP|tara:strand:+ start:1913 stop:2380 length:468 start_codon:yes stop_codon:yes gene_type:complete
MITKKSISDLINQAIEGTDIFLVDLIISPSNQMVVEIDKVPAISIKECVSVSRHIERSLDREVEDFELSVTSPGLDKPFKKIEQYQKNVAKDLKVTLLDGTLLKGNLVSVTEEGIELTWMEKVKVEGKKKKQEITRLEEILFSNIKETKVVVSFK